METLHYNTQWGVYVCRILYKYSSLVLILCASLVTIVSKSISLLLFLIASLVTDPARPHGSALALRRRARKRMSAQPRSRAHKCASASKRPHVDPSSKHSLPNAAGGEAAMAKKAHDDLVLTAAAVGPGAQGNSEAPTAAAETAVSPRRRLVSDSEALKCSGRNASSAAASSDSQLVPSPPVNPIVAFALASSGRFAAFSSSAGLVSLWDTSKLLKVLVFAFCAFLRLEHSILRTVLCE